MPANRLGEATQGIVNSFPPWSKVRTDEQSLGFQFLNVAGMQMDDLQRQLKHQESNYYLPTANIDDLDILFKFRLSRNFSFRTSEDQDGVIVPLVPRVSGISAGTSYTVNSVSPNTLEHFWYNTLPDRLTRGTTLSGPHAVMSSLVTETPIENTSSVFTAAGVPWIPNRLNVQLIGGQRMLGIRNGIPFRGIVRLSGITRQGATDFEYLVFLHDEVQKTQKEWQRLDRVEVSGVEPDTVRITITAARFNSGPYEDFYGLEKSINSKETKPVLWNVASYTNTAGTVLPVLEKVAYQVESIIDRIEGLVGTQAEKRIELLDSSGTRLSGVRDIAIQPFSTRFWVLDTAGRLHIYDRHQSYPNMTRADRKQYDASCIIEPNTAHTIIGDDVVLEFIQQRPIKDVIRHRVYLRRPDNTMATIGTDGTLTAYTADGGFVFGGPVGRQLRAPVFLRVDQRGDWVLTLETRFRDGTTELDQRVVTAESKTALRSFILADNGFGGITPTGLDFDSDHRLWMIDAAGNKYETQFHYDIMLVDYDKKILYFKERYDQVRVTA